MSQDKTLTKVLITRPYPQLLPILNFKTTVMTGLRIRLLNSLTNSVLGTTSCFFSRKTYKDAKTTYERSKHSEIHRI